MKLLENVGSGIFLKVEDIEIFNIIFCPTMYIYIYKFFSYCCVGVRKYCYAGILSSSHVGLLFYSIIFLATFRNSHISHVQVRV